ncbi:MAG: hypothetical protein ACHQYP_10175 [Nitrospiria bacterium]
MKLKIVGIHSTAPLIRYLSSLPSVSGVYDSIRNIKGGFIISGIVHLLSELHPLEMILTIIILPMTIVKHSILLLNSSQNT